MKTFLFLVIATWLMALTACNGNSNTRTNANRAANSSNSGQIKRGVVPVADAEAALIEMENVSAYGTIKIEPIRTWPRRWSPASRNSLSRVSTTA